MTKNTKDWRSWRWCYIPGRAPLKVVKNFTCIEGYNQMLWKLKTVLKVDSPKSVQFSNNFKLLGSLWPMTPSVSFYVSSLLSWCRFAWLSRQLWQGITQPIFLPFCLSFCVETPACFSVSYIFHFFPFTGSAPCLLVDSCCLC